MDMDFKVIFKQRVLIASFAVSIILFLALTLWSLSADANGYTLCCKSILDCPDYSCCGCYSAGSNACSYVGSSYVACPEDESSCADAGCGILPTSTTIAYVPTDCRIISAHISTACSSAGCEQGSTVVMSGTYTGDCAAENFFQIDAISTDGTCDIQFTGGDMEGILDFSSYCDCGSVTGHWSVPSIPNECAGKTMVPTYAALYHGGPPGIGYLVNDTRNVSGSFKLAECSCFGWQTDGCELSPCATGQMHLSRSCDPSGCSAESMCDGPDWNTENLGCGIWCADKGQCGPTEQCVRISDINGCSVETYGCVRDATCAFSCDGTDTIDYHLFKGWNSLSLPCSQVDVVSDKCGAGSGNFYFYDGNTGKWNVTTVGVTTLRKGVGYWFYSTSRCDFTLKASAGAAAVTKDDIAINSGWNQIASPLTGLDDPKSALTACKDCVDNICSSVNVLHYSAFARQWNDAQVLSAGQGYSVECVD
jgi:hypothetical protein